MGDTLFTDNNNSNPNNNNNHLNKKRDKNKIINQEKNINPSVVLSSSPLPLTFSSISTPLRPSSSSSSIQSSDSTTTTKQPSSSKSPTNINEVKKYKQLVADGRKTRKRKRKNPSIQPSLPAAATTSGTAAFLPSSTSSLSISSSPHPSSSSSSSSSLTYSTSSTLCIENIISGNDDIKTNEETANIQSNNKRIKSNSDNDIDENNSSNNDDDYNKQNKFLLKTINKLNELERAYQRFDDSDSDSHSNSDTDILEFQPESIGFAICAYETLQFLESEGLPSNCDLVKLLRERLIGQSS